MAIGKKQARELLAVAKAVKRSAEMTNARFHTGDEKIRAVNLTDTPTDYVIYKTRLYRKAYLIDPMDKIIAALEDAAK